MPEWLLKLIVQIVTDLIERELHSHGVIGNAPQPLDARAAALAAPCPPA
jgi:hypothetical protein